MVKCRKSGNFGRSKTIGTRFIMSLYLAHSIESMRQFNYKAKTRLSGRFSNNSAFSFLTKVAFFFLFSSLCNCSRLEKQWNNTWVYSWRHQLDGGKWKDEWLLFRILCFISVLCTLYTTSTWYFSLSFCCKT